jgi:hypothetical protein
MLWAAAAGILFGGHLYSTDVVAQLEVAGSVLGERPLFTADHGWTTPGPGGEAYVPHGPGWSVLLLPAALVGKVAGAPAAKVAAALTCSLLSVGLASAVSRLAGVSDPWKLLLAGAGSMALTYSRLPFDVTAAALLCTTALVESGRGRDGAAGLALGAALLVRLDCIVFLPSVVRREGWRGLVPGIGAALLLLGAYNLARFGNPLSDGHSMDPAVAFSPGASGLAGLIASPGKGLIWYAPLVLPALFVRRSWRTALPLGLSLLLHSQLRDWTGGAGWGPRFLFPAVPAFVAPLLKERLRWPVLAAGAAGVLVTAASAWSDPVAVEQSLGADAFEMPSRQLVLWDAARSPLLHCILGLGSGTPDLLAFTALGAGGAAGAAAAAMQTAWVAAAAALYGAGRGRRR